MDVYGQYLIGLLDKSQSMYDFTVNFFITDPKNSNVQAYYSFDKNSPRKLDVPADRIPKKQIQVFESSLNGDVNERKPYKFDTLTGKGAGSNVSAQASLKSTDSDGFIIRLELLEKKSHSVDISWRGDKPSWLKKDSKFPGKLMLLEVKNFGLKKTP